MLDERKCHDTGPFEVRNPGRYPYFRPFSQPILEDPFILGRKTCVCAEIHMFEDDEEWTNYHEAGHCVMAVLCGALIERATISPEEDNFHGMVDIHWDRDARVVDMLSVALAGPVAEMIYRGEPYHPGGVPEWKQDWQQAWKLCRGAVKSDIECMRYLEALTARLHRQFSDDNWWGAIAAVRDLLDAHDEIQHEEIEYEVRNWIR